VDFNNKTFIQKDNLRRIGDNNSEKFGQETAQDDYVTIIMTARRLNGRQHETIMLQ